MSATRSRKAQAQQDQNWTAQPRRISQELGAVAPEPGLSIDSDQLGSHFLSEATEQGNFSSAAPPASELSPADAASSDRALPGPNFDEDHSSWEQTVNMTLQHGGEDEVRGEAGFEAADSDELGEPIDVLDHDDEPDTEQLELSLHDSGIRDVSLFDREDEAGEEPDDTEEPELDTEDGGRHEKRDR